MKHISFFIDDITYGGGTERVTVQIANALSKKYKVSIISMKTAEVKKFQMESQIKVVSFHGEKIVNKLKQRLHTVKSMNRLCQQNKIDVIIIVETYKFLNFLPIYKKIKKIGTRIIVWEHFHYYVDQKYSIKWWARYFSAKYSDAIIVLGKEDLKNYKDNLRKINRMEYIYNPVIFQSSKTVDNRDKIVLAVGRLEEQKGFDYLLNIWKRIEDTELFNDWKLCLIGTGSKKEELERQAVDLKLKNFKLLPFQKEIEKFYQKAAIFVLTSRYEGFGLVLLEAQAHALPIISFDIKEGPKEIIDNGVNGYLIKAFDEEAFAYKLCSLMSDQQKRKEMSQNAGKDLDRFQIDKIVLKWENLIESLF